VTTQPQQQTTPSTPNQNSTASTIVSVRQLTIARLSISRLRHAREIDSLTRRGLVKDTRAGPTHSSHTDTYWDAHTIPSPSLQPKTSAKLPHTTITADGGYITSIARDSIKCQDRCKPPHHHNKELTTNEASRETGTQWRPKKERKTSQFWKK